MIRWIMRLLRRGERVRTPGQEAAASALRRVETVRAETRRRGPEVTSESTAMRRLRQQNHFAEQFREIIGGGGH